MTMNGSVHLLSAAKKLLAHSAALLQKTLSLHIGTFGPWSGKVHGVNRRWWAVWCLVHRRSTQVISSTFIRPNSSSSCCRR